MAETVKYPERILKILRQRRGLEEDDKSIDAELNTMKPEDAVSQICIWEFGFGYPGWFETFVGWLNACGLQIVRKDKNNG